ncbi:LINE-1 retrotransposable element ORF1 protein [Plecturocebus cupreus]
MKEKMLRAAREKGRVTHKGKPIRLTADLSAETLQARREWGPTFNILKENNFQPRISYPAKLSFISEGKIKFFANKQVLRDFITTRPALQELLKEALHMDENNQYQPFQKHTKSLHILRKLKNGPGMVAEACNPSTLGGQGGQITSQSSVSFAASSKITSSKAWNSLGFGAESSSFFPIDIAILFLGWTAVAQSWLTAASASQIPGILLPQPPKELGLQLLGRLRQEKYSNPGSRSCSELRSHHCTPAWRLAPGDKARLCLKKVNKQKKT